MEIRKLNTFRGLAAFIVVISHYSNETKLFGGALGHGAGQFGVMLFFMLSGFLMSYLYMAEEMSGAEVYRYAIARVARVVPLYGVIVLSSYVLSKIGIHAVLYGIPDEKSLLSHLALLSGTSILWTIPAEIHFYFIFVLFWWIYNKWRGHLYIFLSMVFIGLVFLHFPRLQGRLFELPVDAFLLRSLPYFMVGLVFGQLYLKWKVPKRLLSSAFVFTLLLVPLLFPKIYAAITGQPHKMWSDPGVLFSLSFVFFSVTFLVPEDDFILSNVIGDFLGKISYSVYLLHLPILWQLKKQALNSPAAFLVIYIGIVLVVSYLSYVLIEKPSRKAIRSLVERRTPQSVRVSVPMQTDFPVVRE